MTGREDSREALLRLLMAEGSAGRAPGDQSLSFSQKRIWFLRQLLGEDDVSYNVPFALRLTGPLDRTALDHAVNRILARHDVLRSSFHLCEGRPAQTIADAVRLQIDYEKPAPQDIAQRIAGHARHVFDLTAAPLLRVSVLELGPEDHVLLLNMHHIIADGWSLALFVSEFSAFYRSRVLGQPPRLPDLPMQYADHARWQSAQVARGAYEPQLRYWLGQLHGAPERISLPADKARPERMTGAGGQVRFVIPASVRDGLKALAAQSGATLFMTLMSAFTVLLHRMSGDTDISVGTPVAGRPTTGAEALIGCFVNTVVIRTQLGPDLTFKALLEQIWRTSLDAFDNQDLPFEVLVEHLRPPRYLSHTPVFQVMMALQNIPVSEFDLPGLTVEPVAQALSITKFDLNLNLSEREAGIAACLEYNSDIFLPGTAEQIARAYQDLLHLLAGEGAERAIGDITMPALERSEGGIAASGPMTGTVRALMDRPERSGRTHSRPHAIAGPAAGTLADPFEAWAREHPDDAALIIQDRVCSYGQLASNITRLARHLQALGVEPGARVGVCMAYGVRLIEAIYAVVKLGAAYVPLDPASPPDRLSGMLGAAAVSHVLIDHASKAQLADGPWRLIDLEAEYPAIPDQADEPLTSDRPVSGAAYVMHTSGSAGKPKAVQVPTDLALRSMQALQARYPVARGDRHLFKTPVTFDVSVWEVFWPLYHGGALVMCELGRQADPDHLRALIEAHAVSVINIVPSLLDAFLRTLPGGACSSLRWVLSGGERLTSVIRDLCFEQLPNARLANLYGPTETHGVAGAEILRSETGAAVPIGTPWSTFRLHVLDAQLKPLPPGAAGELFIGNPCGLAHGYAGGPALTAERFIPDPFGEPGGRLYRTGDICRVLETGELEWLGRLDRQVKIAGVRIEPGEIEQALLEIPGIDRCVVAAMGEGAGRRLAAFIVHSPGAAPGEDDLREHLARLLPARLIPAQFVAVPAIPLTAHGKTDMARLEESWRRAVQGAAAPDPGHPSGDCEAQVQAIFEAVLNLADIDRDASFFDLGGHSLMAIEVMTQCQQAFDVKLPLQTIYTANCVRALAAAIEAAHQAQPCGANPPAVAAKAGTGAS